MEYESSSVIPPLKILINCGVYTYLVLLSIMPSIATCGKMLVFFKII